MCADICVCDKCRRRLGHPPVGKIRRRRKQTSPDSPAQEDAVDEESEPEPVVPPPPPRSASSDHSDSESEDEDEESDEDDALLFILEKVKDPNYAKEMRKRGPTTWHGSRIPPPLRGANGEGPAALQNVFVPRVSKEAQLAEKLRTFEADYAAGADASLLGADYGVFAMDEDIGGPSQEVQASEHDEVNLGEFLATNKPVERANDPEPTVDEPVPQVPDNPEQEAPESLTGQPSDFDEDEALSQEILQLGQQGAMVLNDDILQGLDAGIQDAHRHFYHPPDFSDLDDPKLDDLAADHSLQMRFDSVPDIMLGASADEPISLGDFHDALTYPARRSCTSEEPVLSLAPSDLARSPASEVHAEFFPQPYTELNPESDTELNAAAGSSVGQVSTPPVDSLPLPESELEPYSESPLEPHPEPRSEPQPDPEVDPDLDAEGDPDPEPEFTMTTDPESAKSTAPETPSPQFGADVGLDIVGLGGLHDLFDNRISPSYEESITSVSRAPGSSVTDDTFSGGSRILASEEKVGDAEGSTSVAGPAPFTFVLPSAEQQVELRENLRNRFFTRSVAKSIAEREANNLPTDEGRVTRSRRRR